MPIRPRVIVRCLSIVAAVVAVCSAVTARTDTPFQMRTSRKNPIVWQAFGNWLMTTEDLTAGRICYFYDPVRRTISNLIDEMPTTAAPLGSAIKWLMYTDRYQNVDRLMAGDVDNDSSHVAWWSNQKQVGCGMRDTTCIFGQYRDGKVGDHYPVDLYNFDVARGGATLFLSSVSEKSQFAHDGNLIVYRAYYSATDSRIYGVNFSGGPEFEIAARNGFEPSVCGSLVAWYEVNGSGFNIVAKNLDTGELRTIAYTTANPPRPEAGRGAIFWQDKRSAASTGVDIYGYDWQSGQEFPVTTATGDQLKLRVCDNLVTWTTGTTSQTQWGAWILDPVQITDLAVTLVTPTSVTLGWTSAGGVDNAPVAYDLRMRTDGPITDANWASSTPVPGEPAPQPAGQPESFTVPLSAGLYHFAIKVQLENGDWSTLSDSVCAYVSDEASALRDADEGACISFTGVVSGIGAGGILYCQRSDRCQAVRVVPKSATAPPVGQRVTVTGSLMEDAALRGPVLQDAVVSLGTGMETVKPLGMSTRALGGFDTRYGGTQEGGASNLWARVRLSGKVSYLNTTAGCSFYLNDGSELTDNAGKGVFITSPFTAPLGLTNGKYVSVEGICRLSRSDGRQIEVVETTGIHIW